MTNTTLNTTTVELINAFSKANKVSRAKITELAEQIVAANVIETVEAEPKTRNPRGRKASDAILAIRQTIMENMADLKNVTAKEVAARFGIEHVEVLSTFAFFEKSGDFVRMGQKDKEPGVRGRRENIWSSVNA